jgi:hypothetical protein
VIPRLISRSYVADTAGAMTTGSLGNYYDEVRSNINIESVFLLFRHIGDGHPLSYLYPVTWWCSNLTLHTAICEF